MATLILLIIKIVYFQNLLVTILWIPRDLVILGICFDGEYDLDLFTVFGSTFLYSFLTIYKRSDVILL